MIFVTIGSMFPFDRLVRAMDVWTATQGASADVLAQIGEGNYKPQHMRWVARLDYAAYNAAVAGARLVVAHAGVGAVITAGECGAPIVVLPRRMYLGEHISDHQMETAAWLRGKPGIYVAESEADIPAHIAAAFVQEAPSSRRIEDAADAVFIARLRAFILR